MKNILLGFLIAICFAAAAVKTDMLTIKPATPVSTAVFHDTRSDEGCKRIEAKMNSLIKKGYITKSVTGSDWTYIVVMEKY